MTQKSMPYWTFAADPNANMRTQEALSVVDVLMAFAGFTETSCGATCRPKLLPLGSQSGAGAVLHLRGLWHPCAVPATAGCIVPNDLVLGCACLGPRHEPLVEPVSCAHG